MTVEYFLLIRMFAEKAMATLSSTLAWKIPWVEEPGRLQFMGSLGVRHDWATSLSLFTFHALEEEMATHSSVLAWRIPGTGEPGGLPSIWLFFFPLRTGMSSCISASYQKAHGIDWDSESKSKYHVSVIGWCVQGVLENQGRIPSPAWATRGGCLRG